ncbi:MAG: Tex family protein [Candidatus Omnitrophota bacterium]
MDGNIVFEMIMKDLGLSEESLRNTLTLLGRGATVPFIARYRKERTGGLDEVQIRDIAEKFAYYAELEARKETILKSIKEQGKLTDELSAKIGSCRQKYILEDIYLPFKPRQRTKATAAKEKGLEPLADMILVTQPLDGDRLAIISGFVSQEKGVPTVEAALEESLEIVIEKISESPDIRTMLRDNFRKKGVLISKARYELAGTKTKFESYYNFAELIAQSPSHRVLAIRRGAKEQVLTWEIDLAEDAVLKSIETRLVKNSRSIFHKDLLRAIEVCYRRSLKSSIEVEVFRMKLSEAEKEAINVFAKNLRNLLLVPPAGHKVIMGVDPGIKTGCKVAVIDKNGGFKEYSPIFPFTSDRQREEAGHIVTGLLKKYGVELIAIGNGTASKETKTFIDDIIKRNGLDVKAIVVSEAGASVYSASDSARAEFPDLDITVRGAISIARRVQDPLADLVKIDPKAIGVGQYQHDVSQSELKKALDATVESCVNYVGVELNTASKELLSYVSGIGPYLAGNIIKHRSEKGQFTEKKGLLKVLGLGPKVFEQCAGFLKIRESVNPLDNSAIHPESFHIVEKMSASLGVSPDKLIGNEELLSRIAISDHVTDEAGIPTITDIIEELKKPGLDPRDEFTSVEFSSSINDIDDLSIGSVLEGVVTNVTNFGAFVDVGVHQDGLMHISRMSEKFVKNPYEIVSVGDRIKVKIVSVDKVLKRISLEMNKKS